MKRVTRITDSDDMVKQAPKTDYLVAAAIWLVLVVGFWAAQDDWSWTVLFSVTGLMWMAAPLLAIRLRTRPLLITSATLLLMAMTIFLTMVWGAVMVLGFFGSLATVLDSSALSNVAGNLIFEGLKVVPGAVMGAVVGVRLRSSGILVPVE